MRCDARSFTAAQTEPAETARHLDGWPGRGAVVAHPLLEPGRASSNLASPTNIESQQRPSAWLGL